MKGSKLSVKWLYVNKSEWIDEKIVDREDVLKLLQPVSGICVAVIKSVD